MEGRNIAFDTPEPPNGSVFVIYEEDRLGEENCPAVIWRDDERARRFRGEYPKEARWFRNDNRHFPETWGQTLVQATALHQVSGGAWRLRDTKERTGGAQ